MVGLAFASCEPVGPNTGGNGGNNNGGDEPAGAGEFELVVSNIGETSATVKITPKQEGRTYYWGIHAEVDVKEFATTAAFMQDWYATMKKAVDGGYYTWEELLENDVVEYTTNKVNPSTKYVLWAFGIDLNGNLTSADLSYVVFETKASTFDATQWYGYWELTSPKQFQVGIDPMSGADVEEIVDESLTTTIVIVPGDEYVNEGEVYIYGLDGWFGFEVPAVGTLSGNSIKLINGYVIYSDEHPSYGPIDYTWNGFSYLESYGAFYSIGGNYAPYTFTMAEDQSVKVTAYQGELTDGTPFQTDFYNVSVVIREGEYAGYSLGWNYDEIYSSPSGAEMSAKFLAPLEEVAAQKLNANKKFKVAHKMATPKAVAQKFSSAVRFAK